MSLQNDKRCTGSRLHSHCKRAMHSHTSVERDSNEIHNLNIEKMLRGLFMSEYIYFSTLGTVTHWVTRKKTEVSSVLDCIRLSFEKMASDSEGDIRVVKNYWQCIQNGHSDNSNLNLHPVHNTYLFTITVNKYVFMWTPAS